MSVMVHTSPSVAELGVFFPNDYFVPAEGEPTGEEARTYAELRRRVRDKEPVQPFADAAAFYQRRGWPVLPQTPDKLPMVSGHTGYHGPDADEATVDKWVRDMPDAGMAIRMPEGVIAIDIDDGYPDKKGRLKTGGESLARFMAEHNLPQLPVTFRSTARGWKSVSGKLFYRIPPGIRLREKPIGADVEILQRHHRHASVWPTMHHTGEREEWFYGFGLLPVPPPRPEDLAELPAEWLEALRAAEKPSRKTGAAEVNGAKPTTADVAAGGAAVSTANVTAEVVLSEPEEVKNLWPYISRALTPGEPTKWVLDQLAQVRAKVEAGASCHVTVRDYQLSLLCGGIRGHAGVAAGIQRLREFHDANVPADRHHEFGAMLVTDRVEAALIDEEARHAAVTAAKGERMLDLLHAAADTSPGIDSAAVADTNTTPVTDTNAAAVKDTTPVTDTNAAAVTGTTAVGAAAPVTDTAPVSDTAGGVGAAPQTAPAAPQTVPAAGENGETDNDEPDETALRGARSAAGGGPNGGWVITQADADAAGYTSPPGRAEDGTLVPRKYFDTEVWPMGHPAAPDLMLAIYDFDDYTRWIAHEARFRRLKVSPHALLWTDTIRTALRIHPSVTVSETETLSQYFARVAFSGGGKGLVHKRALQLPIVRGWLRRGDEEMRVPVVGTVDTVPPDSALDMTYEPTSGESVIDRLTETRLEPMFDDDGNLDGHRNVVVYKDHAACWFEVDEFGSLLSKSKKDGSTLETTLCSTWSAASIAAPTRGKAAPEEHRPYVVCMSGGLQPERWVDLRERSTGLAQRIAKVHVSDPWFDAAECRIPPPPEGYQPPPLPKVPQGYDIPLPASANDERERLERNRLVGYHPDGLLATHQWMQRAKFAATQAVRRGMGEVTEELWAWSGYVMLACRRTEAYLEAYVQEVKQDTANQEGERLSMTDMARRAHTSDTHRNCALLIVSTLEKGGGKSSAGHLRDRCRRYSSVFDEVFERLAEAGTIDVGKRVGKSVPVTLLDSRRRV